MKKSLCYLVLLIIFVAIVVACNEHETQQSVIPSSPTLTPAQLKFTPCAGLDPNSEVFKACVATLNTFPRREHDQFVDHTKNYTSTTVSEFESFDRWRTESWQQGTITRTVVMIGPTVYVRQGGSWDHIDIQQLRSMSMTIGLASSSPLLYSIADLKPYTPISVSSKLLGPESLNGISTDVYEITMVEYTGNIATSKFWIGADGWMYRLSVQAKGITATTLFEKDSSIRIEIPDSATSFIPF